MVLQYGHHSWGSHNTHPSNQSRIKTSFWCNLGMIEMVNSYDFMDQSLRQSLSVSIGEIIDILNVFITIH